MTLTSAARFLILNSECHEITNGLEDDPKLSVVYLLQPIAASKPLVWWRPTCGRRARLQMVPPSSLIISSGMGADWSSTARVQRGESATARCASTGNLL